MENTERKSSGVIELWRLCARSGAVVSEVKEVKRAEWR